MGRAGRGAAGPVALSFALLGPLAHATRIQCFAAGAALCSTSLGTTFAVLGASGLAQTRLGSVLGTAAMMDDVVGLVMVQIVASLGRGGDEEMVDIDVANVLVRPVLVSVAFAVTVPLACRFVRRPLLPFLEKTAAGGSGAEGKSWRFWWHSLDAKHTAFVVQTALLIALVVGASYAGASVLLAAYLAGIVVSWWQGLQHGAEDERRSLPEQQGTGSNEESTTRYHESSEDNGGGDTSSTARTTTQSRHEQQVASRQDANMYEIYYSQAVTRILKPFFFASIGFSIPISDMFSGEIVWRGIIYSLLMIVGKVLCGLWLVRFPISMSGVAGRFGSFVSSRYHSLFSRFRRLRKLKSSPPQRKSEGVELVQQLGLASNSQATEDNCASFRNQGVLNPPQEEPQQQQASRSGQDSNPYGSTTPAKPLSLYPAAILSSAMVARGEIGFLISAVAESNGVFRRPSDDIDATASGLFLVVTWAIVLCTIVGPVCVGLLVRRVKKLEGKAAKAGERGTRNVLGAWGVQ